MWPKSLVVVGLLPLFCTTEKKSALLACLKCPAFAKAETLYWGFMATFAKSGSFIVVPLFWTVVGGPAYHCISSSLPLTDAVVIPLINRVVPLFLTVVWSSYNASCSRFTTFQCCGSTVSDSGKVMLYCKMLWFYHCQRKWLTHFLWQWWSCTPL